MKKHVWLLALMCTVFGLGPQSLEAGILLPLQQVGDTTYDPNTGLEWLDLNLTAGQSYNSVLNGWNGYTTTDGFRFATASEVAQLFTDAGATYLGTPASPTTADLPAATLTLSLLGTTLAQSGESRSWMFYDPSSEPTLPGPGYVPSAVFGVGTVFAGYPQQGFFFVPGITATTDYASPEMASALVMEVPEPSPALLAGAALGLSLVTSRRQRMLDSR